MHPEPTSVPAGPFSELFRARLGHRATGVVAALALEGLLLLVLLAMGQVDVPARKQTLVEFKSVDLSEPVPEPPEFVRRAAMPAALQMPQPQANSPLPPAEVPSLPTALPPTLPVREPDPRYGVGPRPIQNPPPAGAAFGPANSGTSGDSLSVGTAPNGETLYQAKWYREPYHDELSGYLSTATGPGWALIACRTAPDFRVEDCVGLDESPRGSMIMRSVLAAAWQFKVRPPRLGGRSLVGSWVRIRIDYTMTREPG